MILYKNENGKEITADKAYHPDYMDKDKKEILLEILNEERNAILEKLPKNIETKLIEQNTNINSNTPGAWNHLPENINPLSILFRKRKSKQTRPLPPPIPTNEELEKQLKNNNTNIEEQLTQNIKTLQQQIKQYEEKLNEISSQSNYVTIKNLDNSQKKHIIDNGSGYALHKRHGNLIRNIKKEQNIENLINKINEKELYLNNITKTSKKLQDKLYKERQRQLKNREKYLQNEIKKRLKERQSKKN